MIRRRGLLLAVLMTPVIVRTPGLLMPVRPPLPEDLELSLVGIKHLAPGDTVRLLYQHELWSRGTKLLEERIILADPVPHAMVSERVRLSFNRDGTPRRAVMLSRNA